MTCPLPQHARAQCLGTRGDVQPFIAVAVRLKADGHVVRLVTHNVFKEWVESYGLEFLPIKGDPRVLSEYVVRCTHRLVWWKRLLGEKVGRGYLSQQGLAAFRLNSGDISALSNVLLDGHACSLPSQCLDVRPPWSHTSLLAWCPGKVCRVQCASVRLHGVACYLPYCFAPRAAVEVMLLVMPG